MNSENVRFGLVGFGAWGQHHAAAIARANGAKLAAICAKSEESQNAAAQEYPEACVADDYRQLAQMEDLDIVDVVVPNYMHHEVAASVLTAGKHLMLEKPMCLSVADCDDLLALAERNDRRIFINHEFRLSSLWSLAHKMVSDGSIGRPQYVLVELSRNPYRQGSDGWRFDIDRVGNWILEEPIHFFDLARWYLESTGDPETVYATANSRQPGHPELQDNFSAIVNFSGGGYAVVSQTLSAFEHHQTVKISGTDGALWASWSGAKDRTRHPTFWLKVFDGVRVRDIEISRATGELFELEDHMDCTVQVLSGTGQPPCTGTDGRWSVAICLAAQQSIDVGQPMPIGTAD